MVDGPNDLMDLLPLLYLGCRGEGGEQRRGWGAEVLTPKHYRFTAQMGPSSVSATQ